MRIQPIKLTRHAEVRANQRGIKRKVMDYLLEFGSSKISKGCEVLFMDNAGRKRLREAIGRSAYAQVERALDTYLVVATDGAIVTCCHRTKPLHFWR